MKTDKGFNIFSRVSPDKKLKILESLSPVELCLTSQETLLRIVKETGTRLKGTRARDFKVLSGYQGGNSWNSTVDGLFMNKSGKLFVEVYIQSDKTDTTIFSGIEEFLKPGDWSGKMEWTDSRGGTQTTHAVYTPKDKSGAIRGILRTYLKLKYDI